MEQNKIEHITLNLIVFGTIVIIGVLARQTVLHYGWDEFSSNLIFVVCSIIMGAIYLNLQMVFGQFLLPTIEKYFMRFECYRNKVVVLEAPITRPELVESTISSKRLSHGGFLPTGETAVFIIAGDDPVKRCNVIRMFQRDYWFYTSNILRLEGANDGEPFLSGQLRVSDEFLSLVLLGREYKPDYSIGFPAKRISTSLDWDDMFLDYDTLESLNGINSWIEHQHTIMETWGMKRILKAGYRALFYGPPGTGKTLAATLLGKKNNMDVYRVDLSMIVSKYIGETEKNLAGLFDLAENRNWILFFDEADALFGKRSSSNSSNDRHANQEVAYLLQRIEDFPGTIILATNLKSNIDEAFLRRFQSVVYFPIPTEELRSALWQSVLPKEWLGEDAERTIATAAQIELSGGMIVNIVRQAAILLAGRKIGHVNSKVLASLIEKIQS